MHVEPSDTVSTRTHAIVIGGSVAGMLAARVLANHYAHVTLIERDSYPHAVGLRKGVPQARHAHQLLAKGQQIMEQLFPGITQQIIAAGAVELDTIEDFVHLTPFGERKPYRSDLKVLSCTRPLIDSVVRQRLLALANLRIIEQADVVGLLHAAERQGISGVRIQRRTDPTGVELLEADLVVDASGRGSRAPDWLEQHGYDRPLEITINPYIGYASRLYQIPAGFQASWRAVFLTPLMPDHSRAAVLFPVEGNRWLVTLAGIGGDYPPTDEAEFLAFARTQRSPLIYEAISQAQPLSGISGYQITENRLRQFDKLARWPAGLIILGDAACAFDPVYGQGMTIAALESQLLDAHLRAHGRAAPAQSHQFQRQLARLIAMPWTLAVGEDLRWPKTTSHPPNQRKHSALMQWYMQALFAACMERRVPDRALLEVIHMLKPGTALFHPTVVWHVLAHALGQRMRRPPSPTAARSAQV